VLVFRLFLLLLLAPFSFPAPMDRVFEKRGKNRVMKRGEQEAGAGSRSRSRSRKQEAGAGQE